MARPRAFDEATALQKALETFWSRGYAGTSVEDLVAGTGLNRASLYATFGDKRQLFMRALGQYEQAARQALLDLTADATTPAPVLIRQVLELAATNALANSQHRGCLLVNATTELLPHDPEAQALLHQHQQFLEALLTGVLARGQQRGEVRASSAPQAQARFLLSVLAGMRVQAKASPDPQLLRDVAHTALLALVREF